MIEVKDLSVEFNDTELYGGLSFHVPKGRKVALKGESGSGKSTLLNVLLGFIPAFHGSIFIDGTPLNGQNIRSIRAKTAYVPQNLHFTVFPTVRDIFFAPFRFKTNAMPSDAEINDIFKIFEISTGLLDRDIKEISGGQKQRILLASAVLLKKPVMLLDEPTSALNKEIAVKIIDFLMRQNITMLVATHDENFLSKADEIIEL